VVATTEDARRIQRCMFP